MYCPLCTTLVTATYDVDDDDGRATTDDDDDDDNDENSYGGDGGDSLCYIDTNQARPALLSELVTRNYYEAVLTFRVGGWGVLKPA